jgi:hypothetical protein
MPASSSDVPSNTTSPLTRITLRSVICVTCFQVLSTMMLLMPLWRIKPQMRQISRAINGARPSVASSRISTIGVGHQCAADGEHLLFAAGELLSTVPQAFFQARKSFQYTVVSPFALARVRQARAAMT